MAFASTITCGSSPGGTGSEQFAFNSGWYGHGCKFTPSTNIDVSEISAEISRIGTTQTFNLSIETDASNKPSGTVLVSGSISSVTENCTVYTASVATTTLMSGTSYWIVAEPITHSTAYICGAGSATVSDKDSSNVWSSGVAGAYYLAATYSTSSSGGDTVSTSTTTTATTTDLSLSFSDQTQLLFFSLMLVFGTAAFLLTFLGSSPRYGN